ncbi:hypothetical protein ACL2XP_27100 [Sodalis sp. RH21]|uniref:hypothetical protein n=1 Tax=unclassified Sodalis (in: enterobacteria) TaxID=2636512 RepID=UPI0039B3CEAF
MFEAINWPADMTPSRSPIHFTNELEVAASPGTLWSLLIDLLEDLAKVALERETRGGSTKIQV